MSVSPDLTTLGKRIAHAIKERRRSQRELASVVGVREQRVSAWVNDTNGVSAKYLVKIARFLSVDSEWLQTGNGKSGLTEDVPRETAALSQPDDVDYLTGEVRRVATEFNILRARKGDRADIARQEGELRTILRFMLRKIPNEKDREDAVDLFFKALTSDSEPLEKSARRQPAASRAHKTGTDRS